MDIGLLKPCTDHRSTIWSNSLWQVFLTKFLIYMIYSSVLRSPHYDPRFPAMFLWYYLARLLRLFHCSFWVLIIVERAIARPLCQPTDRMWDDEVVQYLAILFYYLVVNLLGVVALGSSLPSIYCQVEIRSQAAITIDKNFSYHLLRDHHVIDRNLHERGNNRCCSDKDQCLSIPFEGPQLYYNWFL